MRHCLLDWLIDCGLKSSDQYFSYVNDENKFTLHIYIDDFSRFCLSCLVYVLLLKTLNLHGFPAFWLGRTWWRLFQKRIEGTKWDICITLTLLSVSLFTVDIWLFECKVYYIYIPRDITFSTCIVAQWSNVRLFVIEVHNEHQWW